MVSNIILSLYYDFTKKTNLTHNIYKAELWLLTQIIVNIILFVEGVHALALYFWIANNLSSIVSDAHVPSELTYTLAENFRAIASFFFLQYALKTKLWLLIRKRGYKISGIHR